MKNFYFLRSERLFPLFVLCLMTFQLNASSNTLLLFEWLDKGRQLAQDNPKYLGTEVYVLSNPATLVEMDPALFFDISGSTITITGGTPVDETVSATVIFRVSAVSSDDEYIPSVTLTAPAGWTLTRNSESSLPANHGTVGVTGSGSNSITYTFSGVTFPGVRNGENWDLDIDVLAPAGSAGANNIAYTLNGDGFGANPHIINANVNVAVNPGLDPNDICVSVFNDYDSDGSDDGAGEPGISGLTVTAYDAANASTSLMDSGDGNYVFTPGNADTYRIEVTGIPDGLEPSVAGATTVFFTSRGNKVDVGLHYPAEHFLNSDVYVAVPCYVDGASNGANANEDVMVITPADDLTPGDGNLTPTEYFVADHNQIGATFGIAYSRAANSLLAAAFTKRHAAFGPSGTGAIYKIDFNGDALTAPVSSTGVSTLVDLNALFGANTAGVNPHPNGSDFDRDPATYDVVGKVGLGGLAMSEVDNVLWTINLADRRLYEIPLGGTRENPTAPAMGDINRWPASGDLTGLTGLVGANLSTNIRPFAVKCYRGQIYIGLVYTAESTVVTNAANSTITNVGDRTQLQGYIYRFDPSTDTFTQLLSFPLDYARGQAIDFCSNNAQAEFQAWSPVYDSLVVSNTVMGTSGGTGLIGEVAYPQPWITDIEFDEEGKMLIGIRDRFADQHGFNKLPTNAASATAANTRFTADGGGDILVATINTTDNLTYVLESNAQNGTNGATFGPSAGAGFGEGPGGGEFFFDDRYRPTNAGPDGPTPPVSNCNDNNDQDPLLDPGREQGHDEISLGGLFSYTGQQEVLIGAYDPINNFNNFNNAGIVGLNTVNGSRTGASQIYASTAAVGITFAKGNGLGDLEGLNPPAPIEVGNRLWVDANNNGRQDADEDGLNGVLVELFKDDGTGTFNKVAETTTAADPIQGNGFFLFTNDDDVNQTWTSGTEVLPEMNYEIRVAIAAVQAQDMTITAFTTANTNGVSDNNSKTDLNDSDASAMGVIAFTTGIEGQNNHTLDIGVVNMAVCSITGSIISETCDDGMGSSDTSDDTYDIVVTATVTDGSGSYDVLVDGMEEAAGITSGMSTTITVPASGGTVDITFRDATDDSCISAAVTSSTLSPCSPAPCSVSGSIVSETCDDGMGSSDTSDDTYDIVVTATVTDGSGSYDVLVDGMEEAAGITSGMSTTITVPASGGTVDITFRDATDDSCVSAAVTSSTLSPCSPAPCSVSGSIVSETCDDGMGSSDTSDDTYDIVVTATVTDGSGSYDVLVDGMEEAAGITSGMSTTITVPASGGTVDITFRDATDDSCISAAVTSSTLSPCSPAPCSVSGSIVSETCDDGMGSADTSDDTYDIVVTATVTDGSGSYDVLVDGMEEAAGITSGMSTTITVPASGGTVDISFRDATDDSCISGAETSSVLNPCSPDPCVLGPGVVGGNAYLELDNDGTLDAGEMGQANLTVEIYDCDGMLVCTTMTDSNGDWFCTGLTDADQYRVEFSNPSLPNLQAAATGPDNGSNTQFVTAPNCEVDYGVLDPNITCGPAVVENNAIGTLSANGTLLTSGIAIVTCGIIDDPSIPTSGQFTLGLIDVRNVTMANDRPQAALMDYHHPDWTVTQVGNVFGTTTDNLGNFYATASSHYGSGFGYGVGTGNFRPSIIRYGDIGGGENDVAAAGTVYQMDAVTGQPTVFAQLPQQSFDFTHIGCEAGVDYNRTSGPGLGNIEYDEIHDQFFVSNFEDGAIYRLNPAGGTIDSFDPQTLAGFALDDGTAGFANDFKPYGMAVSPDGNRLYFGIHPVDNDPGTSLTDANVYYIDLAGDGSFSGTEQFLVTTTPDAPGTAFTGDFNAFGANPAWFSVSDLNFNPDGDLVIGHRSGCGDGTNPVYASSHNHGASYFIYDLGTATLTNIETRYAGDTGNDGTSFSDGTGNDDVYGGIGIWDTHDGNYVYVVSSSDIRDEIGPHGLMIFPDDFTQTGNGTTEYILRPSAAVPYFTNFANNDFKGVGGDAEVYSPCGPVVPELGDYIWIDTDMDGIQDPCEEPLENLYVTLIDKTTGMVIDVDTTDANGNYYFTHAEGVSLDSSYFVVFGYNPGVAMQQYNIVTNELTIDGEVFAFTSPNTGEGTNPDQNDSDAETMTIPGVGDYPSTMVNNITETNHDLDAGVIPLMVSLGSTVFIDLNNSGVQDGMDVGIPGVLVIAYMDGGDGMTDGADDTAMVTGADGILGTADDAFGPDGIMGTPDDGDPGMYTDVDGNYFFSGLVPGDYYAEIPVSEFGMGAGLEDSPISSNTVNGFAGETDPNDDADNDDEGLQTGGSGAVTTSQMITLDVGMEPEDSTTETAQGNMLDSLDDASGNMTLDFGFFAPVSLGDTTFVDLEANGAQDPTDPPLVGVTVTLYDAATDMVVVVDAEGGTITGTTTTDMMGFYEFTNLPPGDYYVIFDISTADGSDFYTFTMNDVGDDADDSDADQDTGQTSSTGDLTSGARFPDLDAGVVCSISVEAGDPQTICSTESVDLTAISAEIQPDSVAGFGGTWTTSGDGVFDNSGDFATATTYTPGPNDALAGTVTLTLTTDDPSMAPFNVVGCGPLSDNVEITVLKVDCGAFFWNGDD